MELRSAAEPKSAPPPRAALLRAKLWRFSALYNLVFIAYGTTEILQTSVYSDGSGSTCLFIVYAAFLLSSLLAPLLVQRIGPLATLWRCGFFYMLNVLVSALGPLAPPQLRLAMCACVGLAGGGFWSAQALYVSLLAQELAREEGVPVSAALSALTSRFFVVFSSAQVTSQLLASAFLLAFGAAEQARAVSALFGTLAALAALGTLALARLEAPNARSCRVLRPLGSAAEVVAESAPAALPGLAAAPAAAAPAAAAAAATLPPPTPYQVLLFLLAQPPLLAALPMLFYGGGSLGFVLGPFLGSFSSDRVGVGAVGFVAATFNVVSLACALPMDYLVRLPCCGRRWTFVAGTLLHLAWLTAASALLWGSSGSGRGGDFQAPAQYALVFGAIAVNGIAAPLFQSQLPALLQTWYVSPRESTSAIAVYRVCFSLGFCAAQGLALGFQQSTGQPCLQQQCAVWAALLACAALPLAWLHVSGRRLVE
jgi:MFS family permease